MKTDSNRTVSAAIRAAEVARLVYGDRALVGVRSDPVGCVLVVEVLKDIPPGLKAYTHFHGIPIEYGKTPKEQP